MNLLSMLLTVSMTDFLLDDNVHDMSENSAICNSSKIVTVLVLFHVAVIKYPHKGLKKWLSG